MFGKHIAGWRIKLREFASRSSGQPFKSQELESLLYEADLSETIVKNLIQDLVKSNSNTKEEILSQLVIQTEKLISPIMTSPKEFPYPGAIILIGVNGVGKTTVAAKLARRYKDDGKTVVLAAADTFRAGAIEQTTVWANRVGAHVVAQPFGADPAAVIFDAWQKTIALSGVLIADTAGRMHTKQPLVDQLKKICRILAKDGHGAPHETYLVLDGTTGQNAISQAREFLKAIPITGLIITKLDGTSRGGGALSSALELTLPVRYIGVGEKESDLKPFKLNEFVQDLFRV